MDRLIRRRAVLSDGALRRPSDTQKRKRNNAGPVLAESVTLVRIRAGHRANEGAELPNALHSRKQELVRDAIYNAAIDLFARDGFDETTLEDVSTAAGVSARTLYRYFANRDELLAHGVVGYGKRLVTAVNECPTKMSQLDTVRYAALAALDYTMAQPRIREIIKISSTHPSARQAQQAGIAMIQGRLAEAFAKRLRNATKDDLQPRMLANVTLMVVERSIPLWITGECKDAPTAVRQVMAKLARLFAENND